MKIKTKITIFLILNTIYFILNTGVASAEGIGLKVSPTLIKIKTHTADTYTTPLTIENMGNDALKIKPAIRLFKASPEANGQVEYLTDSENSPIFDKIQLTDEGIRVNEIILSPKQQKKITLRIDISENEPSADYYFSVIFLTNQPLPEGNISQEGGQSTYTLNQAGVASNILLSVNPTEKQSIIVEEFSSPGFVNSGPIAFRVKAMNTGPHIVNPKGIIYIKNMFGQTIGKVDIESANILSLSSRYLANSAQTDHAQDPSVIWPEKFLLGFYTATLSLSLSENETPIVESTTFAAFPLQFFLITGLVFIIGFGIYKRVKKRMQHMHQ